MTRAEDDLKLWHSWKKTGDPEDMRKLLRQFDATVHKFVGQYAHAGVPHAALEVETKMNAINAFKTYDPGAGAQLNTHVTNWLQKGQRLVHENKGLTRIPEHRALKVQTYMRVRDHLRDKFNRPPTAMEMQGELMASTPIGKEHEGLSWSPAEVGRMEKELHKTLLTSEDALQDLESQVPTREGKILDWLYYDLKPEDQAVFEHLTGRGGKPRLEGQAIAKALNMSPSKVSRIRQRIADKFGEFADRPAMV